MSDLTVSSPLSTDKPLWEIHLLNAHKCVVLRVHHALGDGISIMSLMLTLTRKLDDLSQTPLIEPLVSSTRRRKLGTLGEIWKLMKVIWFSLIYVFEFIMRGVVVKDGKTVVRGGEGVELWPRKLVTARFSLDDMKTVKNAVAEAVSFPLTLCMHWVWGWVVLCCHIKSWSYWFGQLNTMAYWHVHL